MNTKLIPFTALSVLLLFPIGAQSVFAGEGFDCPEGSDVYTSPSGLFTISPLRNCSDLNKENPVFYYGDDLHITYNGDAFCGGADQAVSVYLSTSTFSDSDAFGIGGEAATIANDEVALPGFFTVFQKAYAATPLPAFMTEIGNSGIFEITVNLFPSHGSGNLQFDVTCVDPNNSGTENGPPIFLDPSGKILNACTNQPIQGAQASLYDNIGNPGNPATQLSATGFVDVDPPNGFDTLIMDPQLNPQPTQPDGSYGWLVIPSPGFGFPQILWKVEASAPGYISQTAPVGNGFAIPPEVVGLDFLLQPVDGCPNIIGGNIIPVDSTALLVAGAQSSTWMIPVVLSILGIGLFVVTRKQESS